MIELSNITKIYGKGEGAVTALRNVSLKIERAVFTAVVGKSGSGKSTLMNIIGGLDRPTEGSVCFLDNESIIDLGRLNRDELAKYRNKSVGFIFQSFYLEPTFTVLENVAMPLTIRGELRKTREEKARAILEKLDLSDKVLKKANELSGGQKQRVSIARALVHEPSIILADEPTGNLDSQNGAEVIKLLKKICLDGKSVVLVTHNIEDAKSADIMIKLKDGCVEE